MSEEVIFIICYIIYNLLCHLITKEWAKQVLEECKQMEVEE